MAPRIDTDGVGEIVVEELHFTVEPSEIDDFLDVEAMVWTDFLAGCDGFIRKEVWVPEDDSARVIVMIWWASMAQWKSISLEQCEEVDARMGSWLRPIAGFRAHRVVRRRG
jgi:uncharacterized protein (TIGR03792 family)